MSSHKVIPEVTKVKPDVSMAMLSFWILSFTYQLMKEDLPAEWLPTIKTLIFSRGALYMSVCTRRQPMRESKTSTCISQYTFWLRSRFTSRSTVAHTPTTHLHHTHQRHAPTRFIHTYRALRSKNLHISPSPLPSLLNRWCTCLRIVLWTEVLPAEAPALMDVGLTLLFSLISSFYVRLYVPILIRKDMHV